MRLGILDISLHRKMKPPVRLDRGTLDAEYARLQRSGKRLVLGTMASRSGARWLCDIFSAHGNATGALERNAASESFWRYIKFNGLPIDTAGIVAEIKQDIVDDWRAKDIALVFSPYFSHGLEELCTALSPASIIFAVHEPRRIVQSMYNKGMFGETYVRGNADLAGGYQPAVGRNAWSHQFGRVVPTGEEYRRWEKLTQIGRLTWLAGRMTADIHAQLSGLQRDVFIFDLAQADQNYAYYRDLAGHFGLKPPISEKEFLALKARTVRASDNMPHAWTQTEEEEFGELAAGWQKLYDTLSKQAA